MRDPEQHSASGTRTKFQWWDWMAAFPYHGKVVIRTTELCLGALSADHARLVKETHLWLSPA